MTSQFVRHLVPHIVRWAGRTGVDPRAIRVVARDECTWIALAPADWQFRPSFVSASLRDHKLTYNCHHCGASYAFSAQPGDIPKLGSRQISEGEFIRLQQPENNWSHLCHRGNCATIHHAVVEHVDINNERSNLCSKPMLQRLPDRPSIRKCCKEHCLAYDLRLASTSFTDSYRNFEVTRSASLHSTTLTSCQTVFTLNPLCRFDGCKTRDKWDPARKGTTA